MVIDGAQPALFTTPGKVGSVQEQDPMQIVIQLASEDTIKFGRAVALGSGPRGCKLFSGSGDLFEGVAGRVTHASGYETADPVSGTEGEYATEEFVSIIKSGLVTVFVEEAVNDDDQPRIRFAQEDATAGRQDINSSEGFTGSFVPEIEANTYDLDITVDGTLRQVSFVVAPTDDWDTIAASIQAALRALTSALETVVVVSGVMRVTSATTGDSSTISIVAGTAGSAGGDFLSAASSLETTGSQSMSSTPNTFVGATVPGISAATYDLDVSVDTVVVNQLSIAVTAADDWDTIAAALQAALRTATGGTETVAVTGGEIKIASASQGAGSSIGITAGTAGSGGGDLMAAIDALVGYTVTVEDKVDGRTIATGITTLTAVDGSDDPSPVKEPGNWATTADTGKTLQVVGAKFRGSTASYGAVVLEIERPLAFIAD